MADSEDEQRARSAQARRDSTSSSSSSDSSSDSSDSSSDSDSSSSGGGGDSELEPQQPVTDAREITIDVTALNPSLTCKLCNGYYREAHTIIDCLHIFCRTCLERHIVSTRRNDVVMCPIRGCHSRLLSTHPLKTEVRFDRVMQNLVDKLLPQFKDSEDELKQRIAAEHGRGEPPKKADGATAAAKEPTAKRTKFGDEKFGHEKLMIFELRPWVPPPTMSEAQVAALPAPLPPLSYPFVKTSAKVSVKYLRRFVAERLGLSLGSGSNGPAVEVQCGGEVLGADHSLEFIWRTRWQHLHPNQHLVITYRTPAHAL